MAQTGDVSIGFPVGESKRLIFTFSRVSSALVHGGSVFLKWKDLIDKQIVRESVS